MALLHTRTLRGALAGAAAAGVWAAQQPLDKRIFGVDYDDADFLGAVVLKRRGREAWLVGSVLHVANGAAFGALYALVTPSLPGPRVVRGVLAGMAEHLATWPLTRFVHLHPANGEFPQLWGNQAAFAQATWRHVLFGAVLGAVEQQLNPAEGEAAPAGDEMSSASNGHGDVAHLVTARQV